MQPKPLVFLAISLSLSSLSAEKGAQPAKPSLTTSSKVTYECRHLGGQAIEIDGQPNEKAWELAGEMKDFTVVRTDHQPAKLGTVVRLLWDDRSLYLSFVCENDGIRTEVAERDQPVWEGEAAEMFICPKGADAFYYEINFTPKNVIFDSRIESWKYRDMARDWKKWAEGFNADIKSATQIQKGEGGKVTGWSLEVSIPFRDLDVADKKAPAAGDIWLFNVFRMAKKADDTMEMSMWQRVHPEFHRPHQFPKLTFVGPAGSK